MSKRKRVNKRRDKAMFSRTASRGKAINLGGMTYRGGIRF